VRAEGTEALRHGGTQGREGVGTRRRSFRLDRPQCPGCGADAPERAEVVRSMGNGVRLAVNVLTAVALAAVLLDVRWRCPRCGTRFMAGADHG
jgi:ribosomal protein S27AE